MTITNDDNWRPTTKNDDGHSKAIYKDSERRPTIYNDVSTEASCADSKWPNRITTHEWRRRLMADDKRRRLQMTITTNFDNDWRKQRTTEGERRRRTATTDDSDGWHTTTANDERWLLITTAHGDYGWRYNERKSTTGAYDLDRHHQHVTMTTSVNNYNDRKMKMTTTNDDVRKRW